MIILKLIVTLASNLASKSWHHLLAHLSSDLTISERHSKEKRYHYSLSGLQIFLLCNKWLLIGTQSWSETSNVIQLHANIAIILQAFLFLSLGLFARPR